jgi:hypothetical protein
MAQEKRGALPKDGGITTLKSNCQRRGEKSLDHQWRRPGKFTVANMVRDTTNELQEAFSNGAG